ncbi:phosphoketolase [Rhodopirellula halodulae]|uniref:phosphoketolase n=1 Tax=Rhodopirellula halodulae TaxID=2894198 RepID=UPI001E2EC58B|nr:phosphoketolase family protein [Rhodopirellula sp. JC737]MCC9655050.1 phosphoketolase family protein [Rhodopirellula sp. JC737]
MRRALAACLKPGQLIVQGKLSPEQLDLYWCATNYLSAAQIYLRENVCLRETLRPDHIKPRLLGHWGTCPGINLIATHLNRLIVERQLSTLLVTGPGHGAPAILSNLFLDGSLGERYSDLRRESGGLRMLIREFSWPGGFPSHLTPATPGAIHEGGELGYALATAFGAALDAPERMVACIVGDGEAETGPTATAWHLTKYLNPLRDGMVLPIVHLNHYKISSRTILGSMSDDELTDLFQGYGYFPILINAGTTGGNHRSQLSVAPVQHGEAAHVNHAAIAAAFDQAHSKMDELRDDWRRELAHGQQLPNRPGWPVILFRSPKGWTGPAELDGKPIEGTHRSHQIPVPSPRENEEHLKALEQWLRSYQPEKLFDENDRPHAQVVDWLPEGNLRLGMRPESNGGEIRKPLKLPSWRNDSIAVEIGNRGSVVASDMKRAGTLLRKVIQQNRGAFRLFCPDELESNRLTETLEASDRQFVWPTPDQDPNVDLIGSVFEMLSEHTCQALMQGYLLTGRHAVFPCYEAFVSIVDSMMGQYAKFLKRSDEIGWREPVSSFNYLLSSEGWRQDHNGYSHQMPGFLNMLLNKKAQNVRVYLPPDTNCLLSTLDHCLRSTGKINLIVASKQPMPQWLNADEADDHCRRGLSIWDWATSDQTPSGESDGSETPDVVLACCGVYPTSEAIVAARLLRKAVPELKLRLVNITDLLILEEQTFHPHGLDREAFAKYFTEEQPVIFNFHGYPSAVKQLLWNRPNHQRFRINGYVEEGTTTTPFSLLAANGIDRFTLVDQILCAAAVQRPSIRSRLDPIRQQSQRRREEMLSYAQSNGEDVESFSDWEVDGEGMEECLATGAER